MLFARNAQDPLYNSLSDLKSNAPINEWFNLSVHDESTLSQTAQEIESIIKKDSSIAFFSTTAQS